MKYPKKSSQILLEISKYPLIRTEFRVFLNWISDKKGFNPPACLIQVKELVGWINEYSSEKNVILGGDFNMGPQTIPGKDNLKRTNVVWEQVRETLLGDFVQDGYFLNFSKGKKVHNASHLHPFMNNDET